MTTMSDSAHGGPPRGRSTMRDVAALAGVGLKTVSRVINGEPNVAAETQARVRAAVDKLEFRPNVNAGNLRRSGHRTRTIGLIVGNVANPFHGALNRGVEDLATSKGTAVFASSLDDDPTRERPLVSEMLLRRVDGLILTTVLKNQAYLTPDQQRGTAIAFVDREPSGIDADTIITDNAKSAAAATAHLIMVGHRRLAYLGDNADIWTASERRAGFLQQLALAGIAVADVPVIEWLHDEESAFAATLALLDSPRPPTALFTSQNLVTIGALRALRSRGAHGRIALFGFDDIPLADMIEPGVSVVAQNPYEMGRLAAERVFARLDGDDSPFRTVIIPSVLIHRGSGDITPPGD